MRISIAVDFSEFPLGRTAVVSDDNGTRFRKDILAPRLREAIRNEKMLIVDFEGVRTCGSSFLESAFGGLVSEDGFDKKDIDQHLKLEHQSERFGRYVRSAWKHIEAAERQ